MNNKCVSPVLAAIILIAITVAISITVAFWFEALNISFIRRKRQTYLDIYDPKNSTLDEAYDNCLRELEHLNYTIYNAKFQRQVWFKTQNFTDFLKLVEEYSINTIFVDSPKGRGWFLGTRMAPFKAYIWFNNKLPNGETITIYYELKA